jgi:hypothetical protein
MTPVLHWGWGVASIDLPRWLVQWAFLICRCLLSKAWRLLPTQQNRVRGVHTLSLAASCALLIADSTSQWWFGQGHCLLPTHETRLVFVD